MKRKYLVVFVLPAPKAEHARIEEYMRRYAYGGDFKRIFIAGPTVLYLLTSEHLAGEIDFGTAVLNGDQYLVVEVGESFAHQDLQKAGHWLWEHRREQ